MNKKNLNANWNQAVSNVGTTRNTIEHDNHNHDEDLDDTGCDDCTNYTPTQWREIQRGNY